MTSHRMRYKIGLTEYNVAIKDIDQNGNGSGIPVGTILPYSANSEYPPEGFLFCDGSVVSRTMYPDLFALIGTSFGSGDNETTFNLPDLNDRVLQGASATNPVGTYKMAGLPNIEGELATANWGSDGSAANVATGPFSISTGESSKANYTSGGSIKVSFDASQVNPIYGNSNTVQPPALTVKFIIKVYNSVTPSSAQIDLTQYASDLATRLQRQQVPAFNRRDIITTSGTYTAPVDGWYRIVVKGGGGGGQGGSSSSGYYVNGSGGHEGGTTIGYEYITAGDSISVAVGAGGQGGTAGGGKGSSGGDSTVTVNSNTYTGGGGGGAVGLGAGNVSTTGGTGTIPGANGAFGAKNNNVNATGIAGGGNGGGGGGDAITASRNGKAGILGGGGGGGASGSDIGQGAGGNGGDGFATFEYFAEA